MNRKQIIVRNMAAHLRGEMRRIMREAVRLACASGAVQYTDARLEFAKAVEALRVQLVSRIAVECERVVNRSSNYMPLLSMPPAKRRVAAPSKPLTLVERRAVAAKSKVCEWQRKQKLAATKVKQYRKKVSYYTKKGVIS